MSRRKEVDMAHARLSYHSHATRSASASASSASAPSQPPVPITITICGDGGCGKSSITLRLVRSQWTSEYDPTIEDSYSINRFVDGVTYHLALTDTAGQEEYRGMWASSNLGADAFLFVYDITSRASLDALAYFNDLVDMETETRADNAARARKAGLKLGSVSGSGSGSASGSATDAGAGSGARTVAPVKMVAANKCDLQRDREVPAAVGLEWAHRRRCGFMETSARNEVNIEETFALIVRRVVQARRNADLADQDDPALVNGGLRSYGMTKPLTPPPGDHDEKACRGRDRHGARYGKETVLWKKLMCWR